jgi:Uma2 family endonuclease
MIITKTKTRIGPRHHGHKMSLKAFEFAETENGYLVELARGYIIVSDVPNFPHMRQASFIRGHIDHYRIENPGRTYEVLTSMECKLLIPEWESERHPDIAVYLIPPRNRKGRTMWRSWFPDLAIEVVSESSRDRDYTEKRDEYWSLGVKEYWIVDAELRQVLVLRRGKSDWIEKTLTPDDSCETKLLPGFKLPVRAIFEAAGEGNES